VSARLDSTAARNPLPEDYEPEEHLAYLTYGMFKEDDNDIGFLDTRWLTLEDMLVELSVSDVEPDIITFEETMKEAREAALLAAGS